jgi:sulfoxide reductase heme-binding subunit YedZ
MRVLTRIPEAIQTRTPRPGGSSAHPGGASASRKRLSWLKPLCLALGLLPLAKLAWDGATGHLGANPIAEGMNRLGFWTLTFLALSLVPTPAHDLLGLTWPVRVRRMIGLLAFSYAALHFAWYLFVDQFFALAEIGEDIGKRKFITVGFGAFLLLVPLAVTSTDRWVRRLGYARWKRLHRLVYAAAALGVVHFLWRVKADYRKPTVFAVVVVCLLAVRIVTWGLRRRSRASRTRHTPPEAL